MKKVTIIIPMYNAEMFLKETLESIKNQTYENLEVLLINDGSNDGTGKIAKSYSKKDSRFRYIEQQNAGQGSARNLGIKESTGEYIAFVDADDYINREMIESLVNKIKVTNSDVVCGEIVNVYSNGNQKIKKSYNNLKNVIVTDIQSESFYRDYFFTGIYSTNPVDKLYKATIIKKNKIKFGNNQRINAEDRFFQLHLLLHLNSISFLDQPIYYYIQRSDSHSNIYKKNIIKKELNMVMDYEALEYDYPFLPRVTSLLAFFAITREINNIFNAGLNFSLFNQKMNEARKNTYFVKKIKDIYLLNSFELILNRRKKIYTRFIAYLEVKGLHKISNLFVYMLYLMIK